MLSTKRQSKGVLDTTYLLRTIRRLSKLFRVKRLTTRASVVDSQLLDCLTEVQLAIHHPNLVHDGNLQKIYEDSRLVDLLHDMILEDDFFAEPHVRIIAGFSQRNALKS